MSAQALSIRTDDDILLAGESSGEGPVTVLLHGLTATRRYVLMGSRTLERAGHRVISYDARGHGHSGAPADRLSYGYDRLAADLEALLDHLSIDRVLLAGASMGAHTAITLALRASDRIRALALITPAYDPDEPHGDRSGEEYASWDALARGLREDGVEGFLEAYDLSAVPAAWRHTLERVIRQRLSAHDLPLAVADALEAVPRSRPFESLEQLGALELPTVVVASRDEADPGHPLRVGERYATQIPGSRLIVEDPGSSPIAWQGGRLSQIIEQLSAAGST